MNYGRYKVIELIGSGSMGDVYKAHDPQFDRFIALKVLREDRIVSEDYVKRFMRGAAAVGRLSHGGIGAAYDIGQEHGTIYIAMELLAGATLKQRAQNEKIGLDYIIRLGREVAEALHYAHQNGVVHRDIKPENIVCSESGGIKVTDFGIAHIDDPEGQQMTQAGEVLGTPFYMSPEQYEGQPVDGRSDLYSLGVILYELATGRRPFQGENFRSLYVAITTDPVEDPHRLNPEIPLWFSRVIMKAMAREPNHRYSSGLELVQALENSLKTQGQGRIKPQKTQGFPLLIPILVGALLCAAVGTAYFVGYPPYLTEIFKKKEPLEVQEIEEKPTNEIPVAVEEPESTTVVVEAPVLKADEPLEPEERLNIAEDQQIEVKAGIEGRSEPVFVEKPVFAEPDKEAAPEPRSLDKSSDTTSLYDDEIFSNSDEALFQIPAGKVVSEDKAAETIEFPHANPEAGQVPKKSEFHIDRDEEDFKKALELPVEEISLDELEQSGPAIPEEVDRVEVDTSQGLEKIAVPEISPDQETKQRRVDMQSETVLPEPVTEEPKEEPIQVALSQQKTVLKSVLMNSRPEGARLFINGDYKGVTPLEIEVSAQKHEVMLQLSGHGEWKAQLDFSNWEKKKLTIPLLPM